LSEKSSKWWEKEFEESNNYDILHLPTYDIMWHKGKSLTSGIWQVATVIAEHT
jgi:hypothetical protein